MTPTRQPQVGFWTGRAQRLQLSPRWFLSIAFTALVMFAAKTTMAALTFGTNDVTTFQQDLKKLDADGWQALYRDGVDSVSLTGKSYHVVQVMSHPPFMLRVLPFWRGLARITRVPFQFWVRFSCALADAGSLWLLCLYRARLPHLQLHPTALLVFAASPILLMISGFHGNTDPIMTFFVLLAMYTMEVRDRQALSGAILALAMGIKVVAVIFAPALLFFIPTLRGKVRFALGLLAVFLITSYPFVFENPLLIVRQLSRYNSQPHVWGWSIFGVPMEDSQHYQWIPYAFAHYSKWALLGMMTILPLLMNPAARRWPLLAQCGLITFFFMFFAPGFSVQYLVWLAPWAVVLGTPAIAVFSVIAGAFLAAVYTHWCRGLPWYYANSFDIDGWSRLGFFLGIACWMVTGVLLLLFADRFLRWRNQPSSERAELPLQHPEKEWAA